MMGGIGHDFINQRPDPRHGADWFPGPAIIDRREMFRPENIGPNLPPQLLQRIGTVTLAILGNVYVHREDRSKRQPQPPRFWQALAIEPIQDSMTDARGRYSGFGKSYPLFFPRPEAKNESAPVPGTFRARVRR